MNKIIKSIQRIFRWHRVYDRYEVMSLMSHMDYVDEILKNAQDDGWHIAGDILIKNKDGRHGNTYFHIPMKRKIKEDE